jgi:hypothetical protein
MVRRTLSQKSFPIPNLAATARMIVESKYKEENVLHTKRRKEGAHDEQEDCIAMMTLWR